MNVEPSSAFLLAILVMPTVDVAMAVPTEHPPAQDSTR
jgi:hypothetical protein